MFAGVFMMEAKPVAELLTLTPEQKLQETDHKIATVATTISGT